VVREIYQRALEVSRQTPEKFDSLVSLLTTYVDHPEHLVPDLLSSPGYGSKAFEGLCVESERRIISVELKNLSSEIKFKQIRKNLNASCSSKRTS